MDRDEGPGPDWHDPALYAALFEADRSLIAWEWLRRDPVYRAAASGLDPIGPEHFGLVDFEAPDLPVPLARPMWRSQVHPLVVHAERAGDSDAGERFDLSELNGFARVLVGHGVEHLVLSDGLHSIRLDGPPGIFTEGPAQLRFSIQGIDSARAPLLGLRRFLAFARTRRFSRILHPREPRARRWILMLRAYDALGAGATLREIAAYLFRSSVAEPLWREREPSIRLQAQRLVRSARRLAAGEYRHLLD